MKFNGSYESFIETVGKNLKTIISKSDLNQSEIANMLNISQSSLSRVLTGKGGMSSELTYQIASNFDINWNWLILGEYSDQVMPGMNEKDEVYLISKAKNGDELEKCKGDVDFLKEQLKIQANYIKLLEEKLNS